jgi:hypothetical protein
MQKIHKCNRLPGRARLFFGRPKSPQNDTILIEKTNRNGEEGGDYESSFFFDFFAFAVKNFDILPLTWSGNLGIL